MNMNDEKKYPSYDPEMSDEDFLNFMENASTEDMVKAAGSVRPSSETVNTDGEDIDYTLWRWLNKQIDATELLRRLVLFDKWNVLVEDEEMFAALEENRPIEWSVQIDNSGVKRLFVFTGAPAWRNLPDDKGGCLISIPGTRLFASMNSLRFDFLCINPYFETAISYGIEHFAMLDAMAKAVEVERTLVKLRFGGDVERSVWSAARRYQNYILPVIYDNSGKFSSIPFAPDDKNRRLIPIFTAEDAFFTFQKKYFDSGQPKELRVVAPHKMKGEDLFVHLSQMTNIDGIVFNCVSDNAVAFAPQMAQMLLDFTKDKHSDNIRPEHPGTHHNA